MHLRSQLRTHLAFAIACFATLAQAGALQVTVTDRDGKPAADVVVLVNATNAAAARPAAAPVVIAQESLRFAPFMTVVPVGSTLRFVNRDNYDHHVRSTPSGPLGSMPAAQYFELRLDAAQNAPAQRGYGDDYATPAASKKSGTLVVRTETDVGKLHLDKGRVHYAAVNDHYDVPPEKSFYRILTWEDGTFDMEQPEEREFPSQIEMSTEGLLMEAMRQLDEVKRLGPELPPHSAQLEMCSPLIPPLRDLTPDQLDILQIAHNYSRVETVLNKSLAGDVRTSELIVKLIKTGYLKVI